MDGRSEGLAGFVGVDDVGQEGVDERCWLTKEHFVLFR